MGLIAFWILCSPRWEHYEITLESFPLLEGDFGFNLSQKGTLIFFTKNDLSPLGFLKTVLTSEIKFYGLFFTGTFQFSRKEISKIFTYTQIYFHACDFKDIFTETFRFSRALFKIFSRGPQHFHGQKPKNFHAQNFFFTGKKYTALIVKIYRTCVHLNVILFPNFNFNFCLNNLSFKKRLFDMFLTYFGYAVFKLSHYTPINKVYTIL